MVGGAATYPTKDIVDNAVNSADHTTLVAAVKAAPTNETFAKLPAGTVDTLVKPENNAALTKILTYHVVAGRFSISDLKKDKAGGGKAELTTVQGEILTAIMEGGKIMLKDRKGGMAIITIPNVFQSNGVIQVVDSVLLPN